MDDYVRDTGEGFVTGRVKSTQKKDQVVFHLAQGIVGQGFYSGMLVYRKNERDGQGNQPVCKRSVAW